MKTNKKEVFIEKQNIPSGIETETLKFLKDILNESAKVLDDFECVEYEFEMLSMIERIIRKRDIELLMEIEWVYRNKGFYDVFEKLHELDYNDELE